MVIFVLTSCEYEPNGDNFIELTPPESSIILDISLNDINPSDTIYVYQDTKISIKINAGNKKLQQAVVLLDGKEFYYLRNNSPFDFIINPNKFEERTYKLTVNAVFASGTGSLAEMMGLEGYMGEMSWNIHIIPNIESHFMLNYRANEDGFLEVYWDNAVPEHAIEKYEVYAAFSTDLNTTIDDPMKKSFIDYGYVCGYGYYEVRTYLKSGYSYRKTLSFNKPVPAVYFEDMGLNQLRVYWDKPFANGRFNLIDVYTTISSDMNDTTIIVPQEFGRTRNFYLEVKPRKAEYDNIHNQRSAWNSFCQGTVLGLTNAQYAYNAIDNIIYSSRYGALVAFDANTMEEINYVLINGNEFGFAYGGIIASAPHNSTTVVMSREDTWIFADSRFVSPLIIPGLSGDYYVRLAALTSDDRLFSVQKDSTTCQVHNAKTGSKIFDFPFTYKTIYDIHNFVAVSEDGRYFCASSAYGMEVFEINSTTTNKLYTDTRRYGGVMFIPSQQDKLMLRVDSAVEIRQMPDFNLIQKFDVTEKGALLCNVDPVTGNLLYYIEDSLMVAKIDNITEPIFKIRSDQRVSKILNNKLLTGSGILLDINPYINQ